MSQPLSYKLDAEVPLSYMPKLFDYMYNQYLVPQKQRFTDITRETSSQGDFLSYVIVDLQGGRLVKVEIKSGEPIEIKLTPIDPSVSPAIVGKKEREG